MRRNAAGQTIHAMMRTSYAVPGAVVPMATQAITSASSATPIVVTATAHGLVAGNIVTITGVSGNANAIGTFVVGNTDTSLNTYTLYNPNTGDAIVGSGSGTGGTMAPSTVAVYVIKNGGSPTLGTGVLTHIGLTYLGAAYSPTKAQTVSTALTAAAYIYVSMAYPGNDVATGPSLGGTSLGLWSYTPTAAETNAASVAFVFTSPATQGTRVGVNYITYGAAITVTQSFETTAGPILYQALLSASGGSVTNQTTIVLPSATPIPAADDDAYNGCEIVFYDGSTAGQVSVGVVLDYVGSTRTITLREAVTFTVTASDFITIIANQSLQSATKDRRLIVDAAGLADANTVKIGPTGSGTSQTALDLGGIIADSIPADGTRPTLQQAAYMLTQFMTERSVSSTTVTVKKVDGSASLFTLTLNDATTPTGITRAT